MNVVINTDASYRDDVRKGAYAYWINSDKKCYRDVNIIKGYVCNSLEAEMKAITYALGRLCYMDVNISKIHIITDCDAAINLLNGKNISKYVSIQALVEISLEYIMEMKKKSLSDDFSISMECIKGHMRKIDREKVVGYDRHLWCDRASRNKLRTRIKEYNIKKNSQIEL